MLKIVIIAEKRVTSLEMYVMVSKMSSNKLLKGWRIEALTPVRNGALALRRSKSEKPQPVLHEAVIMAAQKIF
jgi:hypothetical protein